MRPLEIFNFHNSESGVVNGNVYSVNNAEIIMLEIIATGSFSATVQGRITSNGTWKNMEMTMDVMDKNMNSVITNANHVYMIDVNGWGAVRVILTANTGSVSIVGRVMG